MNKSGKIIVITGTSSGVGLQTALLLAQQGHRVYATLRNLAKAPEALITAAAQSIGMLKILELDVQKELSVNEAVLKVLAEAGQIDVLINNAGYGFVKSLEDSTDAAIHDVFDVNVYGVMRCTRAVLPSMREKKSGQIITVSSVGGLVGQPLNEVYCAAKFAVEGLMESMATYLEPFFGIKVHLVEPAGIKTEFVNRVMNDLGKSGGFPKNDYGAVFQAYAQSPGRQSLQQSTQSPEQIAAVIAQLIEMENPPLRIRTSAAAEELTANKVSQDPTGLKLQTQIRGFLLGK